jgi:hypothetical protein
MPSGSFRFALVLVSVHDPPHHSRCGIVRADRSRRRSHTRVMRLLSASTAALDYAYHHPADAARQRRRGDRIKLFLLRCQRPVMAQGRVKTHGLCPLRRFAAIGMTADLAPPRLTPQWPDFGSGVGRNWFVFRVPRWSGQRSPAFPLLTGFLRAFLAYASRISQLKKSNRLPTQDRQKLKLQSPAK